MLRAAVIEKSREKREYILACLQSLDLDIQVRDFSNEYDFKENLDDTYSSFDIILLNTTLHHEGDGVELATFIRNRNRKVMITFITTSERYYKEGYQVFATGYILYPFDSGTLHNVINFYYQKENTERRASWMIKEKGGNYKRIFCRNIVYIESFNREISIHLEDGTTIESYIKLNKAEEELPKPLFLRCHQSYIVSLYFVEEMERNMFHVQGSEIPISRKYQPIAKESYYDYIFKKV